MWYAHLAGGLADLHLGVPAQQAKFYLKQQKGGKRLHNLHGFNNYLSPARLGILHNSSCVINASMKGLRKYN